MKRRLVLLRHAKSDWSSGAVSDHARPLNARGRRDAPRIAQRLVALDWQPEYVVSSDAQRTRETFELMKDYFPDEPRVLFTDLLYHAGMQELYEVLLELPADVEAVMAIGHNPGWQAVASWLTGQAVQMTTANAVLMEGSGVSWEASLQADETWKLIDVLRPKELGA